MKSVASNIRDLQTAAADEVRRGERFAFGENWRRFLDHLDDKRIAMAEESLRRMFDVSGLAGRTFLDLGSGSGLFSLAARRLGAAVDSIDYDPAAVACATELRRRFFPDDRQWQITAGSAVDADYMRGLDVYDYVYSWGVLHHTGQMWKGIELAAERVKPGGSLFLAIYNDQGWASRMWKTVKRTYNRLPPVLRFLVLWPSAVRMWGPMLVRDVFSGHPMRTIQSYSKTSRGMSVWRDVVDWVGGYPFEVARPEEIFSFLKQRGFVLQNLKTCGGGIGCNEFVFRKMEASSPIEPTTSARAM